MTWLERWLHSLIWALGVGSLTLGCQVLFGDFKVSDKARGGVAGAGGTDAGVVSAQAGTPSVQTMGPIMVFPMSDLYTSDDGAQARFFVALARRPKAPVTIPITSGNTADGVVSPASLSFNENDWNAAQTVTVTGQPDPKVGNQGYTVVVGPAISDDAEFQDATAVVPITNIDNDGAGFFVTPTQRLFTTETGGQAVFTVVLNSPPKDAVVISLTSSDDTIGKVAPPSLTFTAENWSARQTVTVTGQDDNSANGDRPYWITIGPLTSTDPSFAQLPSQTVNITNLDNDQAGVIVALATGIDPSDTMRLRTSENGERATFTVALSKKPEDVVTILVASNASEGVVSPEVLTFTTNNWSALQTVTVVGMNNDDVADGNQPYRISLGPTKSGDLAYNGLTSTVDLVNVDNDQANYSITLLSGLDPNDASLLRTTEQGASAIFSVALTSKPSSAVQFELTSTIPNEGKVSPSKLDFTVDNWDAAQKVTVTGVDDTTKDGNVVYAVKVSLLTEDPAYKKLPSADVKVVNLDNDVAGITPPKLLSGVDGGSQLITTEAGGTATFSVSLTSKPAENVTLLVSSSSTEGKVMPAMLSFTPADYSMPQIVTVSGVNDPVADGNQAYTVTVGPSMSKDTNYVGLSQSVKVTNVDDDWPYIVVSPGATGATTEKGGTAIFSISLHSQPTLTVPVTVKSEKLSEGTVSPGTLTFTNGNWSTPQNITVTGVDDSVADGDQSYTILIKGSGSEPNYGVSALTLTLVNKDDDPVGLKLTSAANLQTTEAPGKAATFTVALTSQPMANVSVAVSSGNTKEGTVSPASLTFTANTWSTAQTVTVTGADERIADGNQPYTVSLKAGGADPKYAQLAASTVSLINLDNDEVGILVTPTSCATTPEATATFSVVLNSQPLGPVSIALKSDTPMVGAVMPALVSFTTVNWNAAQQVTVTGLDDGTMGMMTPYKIVTAAAVSTMDASYSGVNAADVACVNTTPLPPDP